MAKKEAGSSGKLQDFYGSGFFEWQFSSEEHRRRWEERQYDAERWWGGFPREPVPEGAPLPSWAVGPFTKHAGNPIFAPSASGWDRGHFGGGVHNGAVIRDKDRFIYVYRGEDGLSGRWKKEYAGTGIDYICDIGAAGSDDGVHFTREAGPFFRTGPDERYSFEDVCLVRHDGVFHLFCNRWDWSRVTDPSVCGVFHAVSPDLRRWEKLGLVFPKATVIHRNGVVVQNPANEAVRVGGRFIMYINGGLVASSDDLVRWESQQAPDLWPGGEGCLALADYAPSPGADERILLFTGGHHTGHFYAVGEVSFPKTNPMKPLGWLPRPVLHADASVPWEDGRSADPPHRPVSYWRDTVFFTGMTRHDGRWWAYYGGSEYYTCLATAPAS